MAETGEKHSQAYQNMMSRIKGALDYSTTQNLRDHLDQAIEKAVELGELSREEAEKIADYVHKDVRHAAEYLAENDNSDLRAWMRFDLELIEERLLDWFQVMVDHTRTELAQLSARAEDMSKWYSGEVTGPGTLHCAQCGYALHYHKPKAIPPCPQCGETVFVRLTDEAEDSADASDNAA